MGSQNSTTWIVAASIALSAVALSGSAKAADWGVGPAAPPMASESQVEFGTGWYLRGDIAWSREKTPTLSTDLAATANNALKNGWTGSMGFGYKINNYLRVDLTGTVHKPEYTRGASKVWCPYANHPLDSTDPVTSVVTHLGYGQDLNETCNVLSKTKLTKRDVMLNGYIDLGTWAGVTPYVGAGAGMAAIGKKGTINYFKTSDGSAYVADLSPVSGYPLVWVDKFTGNLVNPQPNVPFASNVRFDKKFSGTQFNFAFALMGGFAYDLTQNAKLDIGYRFANLGKVKGVDGITGAAVSQTLVSHEFKVGMRYQID